MDGVLCMVLVSHPRFTFHCLFYVRMVVGLTRGLVWKRSMHSLYGLHVFPLLCVCAVRGSSPQYSYSWFCAGKPAG